MHCTSRIDDRVIVEVKSIDVERQMWVLCLWVVCRWRIEGVAVEHCIFGRVLRPHCIVVDWCWMWRLLRSPLWGLCIVS